MNKIFYPNTYRQLIKFDDHLGHIFIPNLTVRFINEEGGYFVKTNSQGFRSNIEFNNKKKEKNTIFW